MDYFWDAIGFLDIAKKNLTSTKSFLQKFETIYNIIFATCDTSQLLIKKIFFIAKYTREIFAFCTFKRLTKLKIYVDQCCLILGKNKSTFLNCKSISSDYKSYLGRFVKQYFIFFEICSWYQTIVHVDNTLNDICNNYVSIENYYIVITELFTFSKDFDMSTIFSLNQDFFKMFENVTSHVKLFHSLSEKCAMAFKVIMGIWLLLQTFLSYFVKVDFIESYLIKFSSILGMFFRVCEISLTFLNSVKEIVSKAKVCFAKSLGEILDTTGVLEIIFETVEWRKIFVNIKDYLKLTGSVIGKPFFIFDEMTEMLALSHSLIQNCFELFDNVSEIVKSVIIIF